MSLIPSPAFHAGGTIPPAACVKFDTSADKRLVASGLNGVALGLSGTGQKGAPGVVGSDTAVHAASGDPVELVGPGNIGLATVGTAVVRGDKVESDANGSVQTATTSGQRNVVGWALESGAAGKRVQVFVWPHQITI